MSSGAVSSQIPLELDTATIAILTEDEPGLPERLRAVALWRIRYVSDDLMLPAFLAYPRAPGLYPCLVYNRGGTGDSGALTAVDVATHLAQIASWGYLVIASQYRGTSDGAGTDEFAGRDLADVLNLLPVLDQLAVADSSRIGMWGWSRGGLMTYQAIAQTDRIAAAVVVAGVADAFDYVAQRPDMDTEVFAHLIPEYAIQREQALYARSPLRWPERLCKQTPLLLIHGSVDSRSTPLRRCVWRRRCWSIATPFDWCCWKAATIH